MINFDFTGVVTKLFEKAIEILFPESAFNANKVEFKRLENEELEIRYTHERNMSVIIKVSEKWERDHLERMFILQLVGKALDMTADKSYSLEERTKFERNLNRLIDIYQVQYNITLREYKKLESGYEQDMLKLGLNNTSDNG